MTSLMNGFSPRSRDGLDKARVLAVVALLLAGAGATGCSSQAEASDNPPVAPSVRVRTAVAVERPAAVSASGTVDATRTADLAFQISGPVVSAPVEEGDRVKAGQLLAAVDATDYKLNATQAQATATQAQDEYVRMRQLYERGSLAPNDFAKFEAATHVAASRASLALEQMHDTRLVSPISGVVVRRGIDVGEIVGPGAPVFTVVALDPVTIRVGIPEAQIALIHRGSKAVVSVPALAGNPFPAHVTMIGVSADPASRTYPVKLEIPNPGHLLLPGMIAEAQISGSRMVRALTLPGEAVVRDAEGATMVFIYFPAEQRVYRRRVTVGSPIDREIEITEGLQPGELVVIGGQERMRDGMSVTATVDEASAGAASSWSATTNAAGSTR